eukprot:21540-Heterococcus_DN1.PRE.7
MSSCQTSAAVPQSQVNTVWSYRHMLIFDALKSSKTGVCSDTISRLCLFQAALLLAQHYTMHSTTVIAVPRR